MKWLKEKLDELKTTFIGDQVFWSGVAVGILIGLCLFPLLLSLIKSDILPFSDIRSTYERE